MRKCVTNSECRYSTEWPACDLSGHESEEGPSSPTLKKTREMWQLDSACGPEIDSFPVEMY